VVVGRVAVGQVAAQGGHLAHDGVGDHVGGIGQQRVTVGYQAGAFQVHFTGHGADLQPAIGFANIGQAFQAVDIDQHGRRGQPELEHRDQAVAAGQHLGAFILAQKGDGVAQGLRTCIIKCRRNHNESPRRS